MASATMLRNALLLTFLPALAFAQIDIAAVEKAGPPLPPRIYYNVPSQAIAYNHHAVETVAAAQQSAIADVQTTNDTAPEKRQLKARDACDPQWKGSGPVPSPDTADAFLSYGAFSDAANSAVTPKGYTQTFKNLHAMNNALGYMGYTLMDSYDVQLCSSKCDAIDGCAAFNVAFERSPSLDPSPEGGACDQPPTTTLIKCVFWGGPVTPANAVNDGQWRNGYHVVIAGSNGYVNKTVDSNPGYNGPEFLGNKAMNPTTDCNDQSTLVAAQYWNDGKPFDTRRCAAACDAQTAADSNAPCLFFNTFVMSRNGQAYGQYCQMYSQAWDNSQATLSEIQYNDATYSISYSYYFTNSGNNGLPCKIAPPPATTTVEPSTTTSASSEPTGIPEVKDKPLDPALAPKCDPVWTLSGLDEHGYNPAGAPFSAHIACGTLNQEYVTVYTDGYQIGSWRYEVSETGVTFPYGMYPGHTTLVFMALDSNGYPFITGFDLIFGGINLPCNVYDTQGNPVKGARVEANVTIYPGFTQVLYTDDNGQANFMNLPPTTIGFIASTDDNQIAVAGVSAFSGSVYMTLIPFNEPSEVDNYDFSQGIDGWSGGDIFPSGEVPPIGMPWSPYPYYGYPPYYEPTPYEPCPDCVPGDINITIPVLLKKRQAAAAVGGSIFSRAANSRNGDLVFRDAGEVLRRDGGQDMDLRVKTSGQTLQHATATFKTFPFTKVVFIRFKFVTSEVPGGYFGSQFNDYFIVTIRSDQGGLATLTNSMNNLGRAAFDGSGATDWMELRLNVPKEVKSVQFDIAVSNVGDGLFDSEIIVDKAGDLDCEECGNCPKCKSDPMCSPTCQTRQPGTCTFYRDCMEASRPCAGDPASYALNYGEKNCNAYRNVLSSFSPMGQSFVLGTMMCLQDALRPAITCGAECADLKSVAFASHQGCYVDNGFCGLTCGDYKLVFLTIFSDVFGSWAAIKQAVQTAGSCLVNIRQQFATDACGDYITRSIIYAALTSSQLVE